MGGKCDRDACREVLTLVQMDKRVEEKKKDLATLKKEHVQLHENRKYIAEQKGKVTATYESRLKSIDEECQKEVREVENKFAKKKNEEKKAYEKKMDEICASEYGNDSKIESNEDETRIASAELRKAEKAKEVAGYMIVMKSPEVKAQMKAARDTAAKFAARAAARAAEEAEEEGQNQNEKADKGSSLQLQSCSQGTRDTVKPKNLNQSSVADVPNTKSAALPSDADAIMYAGRKNNFDIGKIDPIHMEKEEMKKASTVEEQVQVARREEEEARDQEAKAVELRKDLECEKRNFNGAADAVETNRRIVLSFERTEDFASKRRNEVALSAPVNPRGRRPPPQAAPAAPTPAPAPAATLAQPLPPPYVAPICTTGQATAVAVSAQENRCKYWPICNVGASACGGLTKEQCRVYGQGGQRPPPPKDELARQFRYHTWTDSHKKRDCAWPCCEKKAWECGGARKANCSVYGHGGSKEGQAPPKEELEEMAREKKRRKEAERRRSATSKS